MEGGSSDGEKKVPEGGGGGGGSGGEPKSKRKMKSASQLQILEQSYQFETYPSEAMRAKLSVQLGLMDRQLQMLFCHRRLKDRKGLADSGKKSKKGEATPTPVSGGTLPLPSANAKDDMFGDEIGIEHGSESGSGSRPYGQGGSSRSFVNRSGVAVPRLSEPGRHSEPPQSVVESRAIAFIEAQLGELLREDGPALGMEFDPLTPGALVLLFQLGYHRSLEVSMRLLCMTPKRLRCFDPPCYTPSAASTLLAVDDGLKDIILGIIAPSM